jgi:hypothetical protein
LHNFFAAERLQGEWFKRTPRIRKFIDMLLAIAACRPEKELQQERRKWRRHRKAQEHKQSCERAALANLTRKAVLLINTQGRPAGLKLSDEAWIEGLAGERGNPPKGVS